MTTVPETESWNIAGPTTPGGTVAVDTIDQRFEERSNLQVSFSLVLPVGLAVPPKRMRSWSGAGR
jgi:hypothetical protein